MDQIWGNFGELGVGKEKYFGIGTVYEMIKRT